MADKCEEDHHDDDDDDSHHKEHIADAADAHQEFIDEEKQKNEKFSTRQKMAWISLSAIIIATFLMMFVISVEKITALSNVISWFYMSMATVIGTYMGTTTWAYINGPSDKS